MGWAPIYNIEAELYPTELGRWTWLLEYEFPWHSIDSKHQYLQCLNLQFEGRRYFKRASYHSGHYLSAYVGANWKLELFVKGGFYMSFYDPYDAGSPYTGKYYYDWYDSPGLFIKRNMVFRWLGPTGLGVTLSYDLISKKVKKEQ